MLSYPMLTQKGLAMDQNQITSCMGNKTKIQLVEMEMKTIGLEKLQLLIDKRSKQQQNISTLESTTRYLSRRI